MTAKQPKRIQLRRTKGWRKPEGAVVVSRPSRWGNPFVIGAPLFNRHWCEVGIVEDRAHAADLFRRWLSEGPHRLGLRTGFGPTGWFAHPLSLLADHDLACWCPLDQPCHADVLLELANAPRPNGA